MGAHEGKLFEAPNPPSYDKNLPGLFFINDTIPALFYEWSNADGERAHFTLVCSGDNTEDLGKVYSEIFILKDALKVNLLAFDHCGFGLHNQKESEKITEKDFYETMENVVLWLVKNKNVPIERIVLLGKGLGTGPVVHIASELYNRNKKKKKKKSKEEDPEQLAGNLAAVVLAAPMTSMQGLLSDKSILRDKDAFVNYKKIGAIQCPILLAHGLEDTIISPSHSQKLKKLVRNTYKYLELPDTRHYALTENDDFLDSFIRMLQSLSPITSQSVPSTPRAIPEIYKSPEDTVKEWLRPLKLEKHAQLLVMYGYIDMLSILELNQSALISIGIIVEEEINSMLSDIQKRKITQFLEGKRVEWGTIKILNNLSKEHFFSCYKASHEGKIVYARKYTIDTMDPESFLEQCKRLLSMNHPNILKPYGVCFNDYTMVLLLPWQETGTIEKFMKAKKELPLTIILDWAHSIASAISYLHSMEPPIFHGKINSRNIYVNDEGPLLGGLDIVSPVRSSEIEPEIQLLKANIGGKMDIYAFGRIFCQLLHYQDPQYSELSLLKVIKLIQAEIEDVSFPNITNNTPPQSPFTYGGTPPDSQSEDPENYNPKVKLLPKFFSAEDPPKLRQIPNIPITNEYIFTITKDLSILKKLKTILKACLDPNPTRRTTSERVCFIIKELKEFVQTNDEDSDSYHTPHAEYDTPHPRRRRSSLSALMSPLKSSKTELSEIVKPIPAEQETTIRSSEKLLRKTKSLKLAHIRATTMALHAERAVTEDTKTDSPTRKNRRTSRFRSKTATKKSKRPDLQTIKASMLGKSIDHLMELQDQTNTVNQTDTIEKKDKKSKSRLDLRKGSISKSSMPSTPGYYSGTDEDNLLTPANFHPTSETKESKRKSSKKTH